MNPDDKLTVMDWLQIGFVMVVVVLFLAAGIASCNKEIERKDWIDRQMERERR